MKDIKNHATLTDNLVSWWHLGDGGGVRYDQHGSNNLTDRNSVGYEKGLHGNCAVFDKDNSETLSLPLTNNGTLFTDGQDVSLSMFVNMSDISVDNVLMGARANSPSTRGFSFLYRGSRDSGSRVLDLVVQGGEINSSTFSDLESNKWYFITATLDVSTGVVGFDVRDTSGNVLLDDTQTNTSITGNFANGSSAHMSLFSVFGSVDFDTYASGQMQSLGVWNNKILSSSEKDDLYNYGVPLPPNLSLIHISEPTRPY